MTKYKNIKNSSINNLRNSTKTKHTYIKNGGWHFTNPRVEPSELSRNWKHGHQEYNNAQIKSKIKERNTKQYRLYWEEF